MTLEMLVMWRYDVMRVWGRRKAAGIVVMFVCQNHVLTPLLSTLIENTCLAWWTVCWSFLNHLHPPRKHSSLMFIVLQMK
jgi:hypothetical protein